MNKSKVIKQPDKWVYSTCGYCSVGCGLDIGVKDGKAITVRGHQGHPVNDGKLCLKGIWEFEAITGQTRLTTPMIRQPRHGDDDSDFTPSSWDDAIEKLVSNIRLIQEKYGRDSFAVISTGQLSTEAFYTLGKLVRGVIGTNNYDGNTTLCMSSAVAGYKKSFGSDGPPGAYSDFDHTDCLLAFGSNLVEAHPVLYYRLANSLEKRKFPVIVVDPRKTVFAQKADIHVQIKPATDIVFINAIAHILIKEGMINRDYIEKYTTGYDELADHLEKFTPEYASQITGVPVNQILEVARIYGKALSALSIWCMGVNQSINGTNGVVAINNISLLTGNIGKPGGSSFSITGQCNAMGTREFSSASGLPGYRALENETHRAEIADFWGIDQEFLPHKRGKTIVEIFRDIEEGKIKGLWVIGTNPLASLPNTNTYRPAVGKVEFLAVQDVYMSKTCQYADIILPAAMWGEYTSTFTNSERRVNLHKQAVNPPGIARSDYEIFMDVGEKLGKGEIFHSRTSEAIFNEIREISKGRLCDYTTLDYAALESNGGIQWGGERLYSDGHFSYPDGRAKLIPVDILTHNEMPDEEFNFMFNTGRVIEHWHTMTKTGHIGNLSKFIPEVYFELHPDDAAELGIKNYDMVKLRSRRGECEAIAVITSRVLPRSVFMPMHFPEANFLSLGLLDETSKQPAYKQCAVKIVK